MIKTLQRKLLNIKNEIDTKLLPENIVEGVTILNVTGTLSADGPMSEEEYEIAMDTIDDILGR